MPKYGRNPGRGLVPVPCEVCGKVFQPYRAHQTTCSTKTDRTCYNRSPQRRQKSAAAELKRVRPPDYAAKRAATSRRWAQANRKRVAELSMRYAARKKAATVVPFSADDLIARLSMFSGCWVCGAEPTEIDHVKPLSRGGIHALCNLRPICVPCNRRKNARWPFTRDQII